MKKAVLSKIAAISAVLTIMLAAEAAEPDWLVTAKTMAEDGEQTRIGRSDETGGYVIAIAKIGETGDEAEMLNAARIAAKRLVAGIVGGENVEVAEHFSASESANGDDAATSETYSQSVKVNVDAILKGAMTIGTVNADDSCYTDLLATQKNADASVAMDSAVGDNPNVVKVVGFAPISGGDIATAQRMASESAKSQAIEQVLGTAVAAADTSMNDKASAKVFASAAGFIKQFRVIQEGKVGDATYRVEVVIEVAKDELLKSYKAALEALGDVRFHVECGNTFIREKVIEAFSEWGCNVTEDREYAQYLIACHGSFQGVTHPANGSDGTRCVLSIRIVDRATGREMLTAQNDTRKSVAFTGDETRRRRLSAEKAMQEIHGTIHGKLDEMVRGMVASGRDARLEFDNYSEAYAASLDAIAAALDKIPGCEAPKTKADAERGVATIVFRCKTDMDTVRKYLNDVIDTAGVAFKPHQIGFDANSVSFTW